MIGGGASDGAVRTAGVAGLVAGALSMAVGEYVSVSSQSDVTKADLNMEARALRNKPRPELAELTEIWTTRGLPPELPREVAVQLTEADALPPPARERLGPPDLSHQRPFQTGGAHAETQSPN